MVEIAHDGVVLDDKGRDAILVRFDGTELWLPRSQVGRHDSLAIEVTRWLIEKEGLEGYAE